MHIGLSIFTHNHFYSFKIEHANMKRQIANLVGFGFHSRSDCFSFKYPKPFSYVSNKLFLSDHVKIQSKLPSEVLTDTARVAIS